MIDAPTTPETKPMTALYVLLLLPAFAPPASYPDAASCLAALATVQAVDPTIAGGCVELVNRQVALLLRGPSSLRSDAAGKP